MPIDLTPIAGYNIFQESEHVCCYTSAKLLWSLRFRGSNKPTRSAVGSIHFLSISAALLLAACFHSCFWVLPRKFPTMYLARQDVGTKLAVWESEEAHNQSKSLPLSCYESWDRISSSYHTLSFAGVCQSFPYDCTNSGATWDPYFLTISTILKHCDYSTLYLKTPHKEHGDTILDL